MSSEPRIYRASSLGYSLEALVAPFLGFEPVSPPEWLQEKFNEGHRIEPLALQKLAAEGWFIWTEQEEVNSNGDKQIEVSLDVIPGKVRVIGHLDGIAEKIQGLTSKSSIVEIKRMYAKGWEQFKLKGWDTPGLVQKYKWQASAYMLAAQLPHVMVAWNADTEELAYAVATEPFYSISDIANKLQAAEDHIRDGTIPEGCTDYPCFFHYLHGDKPNPPVVTTDHELESIMRKWLEADKAAKVYEKEKDGYRAQIIEILGEMPEEGSLAPTIKGQCGVTVSTTWQKGGEYSGVRKSGWVTKVQGPRQ